MTIIVFPFDRPEIVLGFSIICHCVFRLRPVRTSTKITTELFASYGLIPYHGGFSDTLISGQFNCSIFDWECEVFTIFRRYKLLRAWISDTSQCSSSSMSATKIYPFQHLAALYAYPKKIPGNTVSPN